ncbi:hypothetical protein Pfo_003636, partial [Paulownia fortunei]
MTHRVSILEEAVGHFEATVKKSTEEVAHHKRKVAKIAKSLEELKFFNRKTIAVEAFKAYDVFDGAILDQAFMIYVWTICGCRRIMRESGCFLEDDVMLLDPE